MESNKKELKEVKVFLDVDTKQQLQLLAKAQNKSLKKFISDSLEQFCDIYFLNDEIQKLKKDATEIMKKTRKI